jgi:hypothetical protein
MTARDHTRHSNATAHQNIRTLDGSTTTLESQVDREDRLAYPDFRWTPASATPSSPNQIAHAPRCTHAPRDLRACRVRRTAGAGDRGGAATPARASAEAARAWDWRLTISSAFLSTIAFNLMFFVQELFLVLP